MAAMDFNFNDHSLSGEERLENLLMLDRGFIIAMQTLIKRVQAYNNLLEEEMEQQPAAVQYLQKSRQSALKALKWLDVFRDAIESDHEYEAFTVRIMVEGAVKRCQRVVAEAGKIEFSNKLKDEVLVNGSFFQLQDLFMNLLSSFVSLQKTAGTEVTRVQLAEQQFEEHALSLFDSSCSPGRYVTLSLTAVAEAVVEPQQLEPLWNMLLDRSEVTNEDIALLQVYGIAAEHGGDLAAWHVADGNYGLVLLLPTHHKRQDMQAPHDLEDSRLQGTETILLVDDEDMIWDVIIDMLQELGYSVILAGNGREAVEIYQDNRDEIDLVLLDMVMPEMDGHEAFFRLKSIDANVRVLLSSGYVSENDARDVLDAGAAGFLQKPYRMTELAHKVRQVFAAHAGA